jgi:hemoglobin-like flavoprotein
MEVVARFYELLFERHPELQQLFPDDMSSQHAKLLSAVSLTVSNLKNGKDSDSYLLGLGKFHGGLGVRGDDYEKVVDALISAVAEFSGAAWDQRIDAAWRLVLTSVSTSMLKGH